MFAEKVKLPFISHFLEKEETKENSIYKIQKAIVFALFYN